MMMMVVRRQFLQNDCSKMIIKDDYPEMIVIRSYDD